MNVRICVLSKQKYFKLILRHNSLLSLLYKQYTFCCKLQQNHPHNFSTMQTPQIKALYTLKSAAAQHLKNKQFSQAYVYYSDIVSKLNRSMELITSEEDMLKLIQEVKIPSHKNLSLCHLKMNENQACIRQCEEVLNVEPNCLKTLYRISKAYMNLKLYDEAEGYLKRGFAIDPNEQEIQKALAEIETAKNPVKQTKESFFNLKTLLALILYWPLLIFNYILTKIFGKPAELQEKQRTQ